MTEPESRFHAEWLGLVQPVEGLVVSVPVLADAQCMRRQSLALQQRLADLAAVVDWTPCARYTLDREREDIRDSLRKSQYRRILECRHHLVLPEKVG